MFVVYAVKGIIGGTITFLTGSGKDEFFGRLQADWWRTAVAVAVGIIVGGTLLSAYMSREKPKAKALNILLAAACGIGAAWVIWDLYNAISNNPVPLFPGVSTPRELFTYSISGFWPLISGVVSAVIAYLTMKNFAFNTETKVKKGLFAKGEKGARKGLNIALKVAVLTGTWAFLMLLTSLIIGNFTDIQAAGFTFS